MALRQRHYAIVEPCLLGHQPLETGIDLRRTPNQPLETELGALFAFELPFEGVIGRITAGDERDHAIQGSNAAYHRAPRAPARRCTSRWPATAVQENRARDSRARRRCVHPVPIRAGTGCGTRTRRTTPPASPSRIRRLAPDTRSRRRSRKTAAPAANPPC